MQIAKCKRLVWFDVPRFPPGSSGSGIECVTLQPVKSCANSDIVRELSSPGTQTTFMNKAKSAFVFQNVNSTSGFITGLKQLLNSTRSHCSFSTNTMKNNSDSEWAPNINTPYHTVSLLYVRITWTNSNVIFCGQKCHISYISYIIYIKSITKQHS